MAMEWLCFYTGSQQAPAYIPRGGITTLGEANSFAKVLPPGGLRSAGQRMASAHNSLSENDVPALRPIIHVMSCSIS